MDDQPHIIGPSADKAQKPPNTQAFDLEINGRTGHFVFRRITLVDQVWIGVEESKLLHGAQPEEVHPATYGMARSLATLKVVLVEKPEWFDVDKCTELDEIMPVIRKYFEWAEFFRPVGAGAPESVGAG